MIGKPDGKSGLWTNSSGSGLGPKAVCSYHGN